MTNPQSPSADIHADPVDEEPIRINERPGSVRPTPLRPPPNYLSNRVRLHLAALVFAFLLLLVLMNEARKPENWAWIGFDQSPQSLSNPAESVGNPERPEEASHSRTERSAGDSVNLVEGDPLSGGNLDSNRRVQAAGDYEEWSAKIWQRILARLEPSLVRRWTSYWLATAAGQQLNTSLSASLPELIAELDRQLADELAVTADGLENQQQSSDRASDWRNKIEQEWIAERERLINPDQQLSNDAESARSRQQAAETWIRRLWPLSLRMVEDRTEMTRSADGPAWLLVWHAVLRGLPLEAARSSTDVRLASHYELMSQPESFRGTAVKIRGELRGIETILVAPNELNLERYYALWIKPDETGSIPFCVYASQLPAELPAPEQGWRDIKVPLEIVGRFFKLRSYLTAGEQVEVCPLILSKQIQLLPADTAVVSAESKSVTPSWAFVIYVAFLPIAAAWIAWRVYQSTRFMSRRPSSRGEIANEDWERLKGRSEIKSTRERLADMHAENGESPS